MRAWGHIRRFSCKSTGYCPSPLTHTLHSSSTRDWMSTYHSHSPFSQLFFDWTLMKEFRKRPVDPCTPMNVYLVFIFIIFYTLTFMFFCQKLWWKFKNCTTQFYTPYCGQYMHTGQVSRTVPQSASNAIGALEGAPASGEFAAYWQCGISGQGLNSWHRSKSTHRLPCAFASKVPSPPQRLLAATGCSSGRLTRCCTSR